MTVSVVTEEDIPYIAELERLCFSHPWSERAVGEELKNPLSVFFCIRREDGTPAAYGGVQCVAGEGYILNIGVHPDCRRRGYGGEILQALIDRAEKECDFITLEVRASNTPAMAMYRKYGFEQVGRRKNLYDAPVEDGILMTRSFHCKKEI